MDRQIKATIFLMAVILMASYHHLSSQAAWGSKEKDDPKVIMVFEYPGYMETIGNVYNIKPAGYEFMVVNQSQKDAGFVLTRDGQELKFIHIKKGRTARFRITLQSGRYQYFCPIIPTPFYPITVK